jgi:hypothetical protein
VSLSDLSLVYISCSGSRAQANMTVGSVNIMRYGAGPNGVMRTLGQYMLGSGATFGQVQKMAFHQGVTNEALDSSCQLARPSARIPLQLSPRPTETPEGIHSSSQESNSVLDKHKKYPVSCFRSLKDGPISVYTVYMKT